ncbi:cysteine desulfurase [Sporobacter termitidis DSM 10068]|uniref:Cysteine desulfurase IscS n=1 Tax=Sporobacter termitidis DSM 10068 TaxID=1123282 RepID=A0A1M5Z1G3_9FIRM|nr:cysteine desulfurase NifS [Sporobacter termitidis]SHI18115.1 cysteine desulfurase [Sporobacter termitidis DSM 10068]
MSKIVYADNAATTFLSKHALEAMMPFLTDQPGNASTVYAYGRAAKRAVEDARSKVAAAIGAKPEEVYFTSGGTESDNWAIKGVVELRKNKGKHIISTEIEHHAVQHTLQYLEKQGYEVTYLKVDQYGNISLDDLRAAIRPDTILITVMTANNEIGTILPIAEIGAIAQEKGILFHTDAVQAVGHIPVNVSEMNVDLLSLSGHKFKGPKGTGALYMKKGLRLPALLQGGGQERGVRSGTENVPGIVGLGAALEEATANLGESMKRLAAMREKLVKGLTAIPYTRLTGDPVHRLPGIASFVFECVEGESMVLLLDQNGICGSSGSACSSGSLDPSHVLMAIGLPHEIAHGSLRLSLNEDNTEEDIDYLLEKIPPVIERLRAMSPLWEDKMAGIAAAAAAK